MILLDTHVLLWWFNEKEKLPAPVLQRIRRARRENALAISAMTVWEIAMLVKKGRLKLSLDVASWIAKLETLPFLQIIPVTHDILLQSVLLPEPFHPDPADRIIVATARVRQATLITRDDKLLNYAHVATGWAL